jgi:5-(carboxyamino)imidazole ribonucleotide synthase
MKFLPPGSTLGVLGGGQLGRMLAHAAARLGYRMHVYEPAAESPAGEVSARRFTAPYGDLEQLQAFARSCSVVTYEFENVPVEPLWSIESIVPLRPHWSVLETCQNRLREKMWLRRNGFPHVPFVEVEIGDDLAAALRRIGLPAVVKTADFGYDGKGQLKVRNDAGVTEAVEAFRRQRAIVEKFVDFKCELSVIVARTESGEVRTFPVAENIHTKHILDFSIVPARVTEIVRQEAEMLARDIANKFELVGLLAVELFLTDRQELLVNEMAPRTHNSGHWSLDACVTSQFEQQVRAVANLPLGDTSMTAPAAVMVNILGEAWRWRAGELVGDPAWGAVLAEPRAKLHLYGKREPRVGRKMGHFTLTGAEAGTTLEQARQLKARLHAVPAT